MTMARKALLAQINSMEARLARETDEEISTWADEIVEEEADIIEESTDIPVEDSMDFSDQNTKMSSVADSLVMLAKSLMGEESEADKDIDKEYVEIVNEEDKIIEASDDEDEDDKVEASDQKIASVLVRLASMLLAEDDEDDSATTAAEEAEDEEKKEEMEKLSKVIAYATKKLAALQA